MAILLLGLFLSGFAIASMLDANRISTRLRVPGVFDLMGPDRYLMAVGVALLLLGLGLIIEGARQVRAGAGRQPAAAAQDGSRVHLWLLAVIVLYAALMPVIGYTLATLAFFIASFHVMGMRSWRWNLASAAALALIFFLVFRHAADMPLPKGWLGIG